MGTNRTSSSLQASLNESLGITSALILIALHLLVLSRGQGNAIPI